MSEFGDEISRSKAHEWGLIKNQQTDLSDPAVLKMKPAIELIRRGRIPLILFPRVLKPFPIPLAAHFRRLVNALTITPIVVPTARTTVETVNHTL